MTYLQVDRESNHPSEWNSISMRPGALTPGRLLRDYWSELRGFQVKRLPLRFVLGFSSLWLLQRLAYSWGWRSARRT